MEQRKEKEDVEGPSEDGQIRKDGTGEVEIEDGVKDLFSQVGLISTKEKEEKASKKKGG